MVKTLDRTFNASTVNKDDLMSFSKTQNTVYIDPTSENVSGERYKTFAEAFAYIATQSPSALSTWTVEYDGVISENIIKPEFVTIKGKDKNTSKLTCTVSFASSGTYESNKILNSTIETLVVDNSALPPIPVTMAPFAVYSPYSPNTYMYGFGGSIGSYKINFTINGATYSSAWLNDSDDTTVIKGVLQAIDPLFIGVTVDGMDPVNATVEITMTGLPAGTSTTVTFMNNMGMPFTPAINNPNNGNPLVIYSSLDALPTAGDIELTMDYSGSTFSTGLAGYTAATVKAGLQSLLTDIQTATGVDNGISRVDAGVGNVPGLGNIFYIMFKGFYGAPALPYVTVVPATYSWTHSSAFIYSLDNCTVNDTLMGGSNNLAKIDNCNIYGGSWNGYSGIEIHKSTISPVENPIYFGADTNIFHCHLEGLTTGSLTLSENTIFLCSIIHPQFLTLQIGARLRQSTFSFGSLTIPNGTNCKSFGCFYIDPVMVDAGGNFTSFGDILEQGHGGAGSWNSPVGTTFDPAVKGILNPATWETQAAIDELTDMVGAMSSGNDIIWSLSTDPAYEDLYTNQNIASKTAPFKILLADSTATYKISAPLGGVPYANNNLITFESLGNPTNKPRLLFEGDWAGVQSTGTYACLNGVEVYNNITTATASPFKIIGDSSKVGIIPPQMINSTITQSAGCIAPLFTYTVPFTTYMNMLLVNSSMDNGGASRPVFDIIDASPNTLNIDCYEYDSSSVAQDVFGSLTNDSTITFKIESNCSAVLNQFGMTANVSIEHLDNASKVLINDVYNINNIPVTDVESLVTKAAIQTYKWDMGFEPYFSNFYTNKKISHPSYPAGNHFIDLVNGSTFNLDPEAAIGNYLNLDYLSLRGRGTSNSRIAIQDSAKSDAFFNQLNNLALINFSTAGTGFVDSSIAGTYSSYFKGAYAGNDASATKPLFYNSVDGVNVTLKLDDSTLENASASAYIVDSSALVHSLAINITKEDYFSPDIYKYSFSPDPTTGTYDIVITTTSYGVLTVANVPYNTSAASIQTQIRALSSPAFDNVFVSGDYQVLGISVAFYGVPFGEIVSVALDNYGSLGAVTVNYTSTSGSWEVQKVTLIPAQAPDSGNLVLNYNGTLSGVIHFDDDATETENAMKVALASATSTGSLATTMEFEVTLVGETQTDWMVPLPYITVDSSTLTTNGAPGTVTIYLHNGSRVIGEVASPTTPLIIYYDNTSFYDIQTNPLASYQPLSEHNKDLGLQGGDIALDEFYHLTLAEYETVQNQIMDILYADLVTAIGASTLIKGQKYRITDYQTIHLIPNTTDINTAAIEPLIVTAIATNLISKHAVSEAYSEDLIEYEYTLNIAEDAATPRPGLITYRKDTALDVEAFYDWRTYKFRRWAIDPAGINSISGAPYTWSAVPVPTYASYTGDFAGALSTPVTITADNTGPAGNINTFNVFGDINTAIATWNGLNPSNTISLTSGDGTQSVAFYAPALTGGFTGIYVKGDVAISPVNGNLYTNLTGNNTGEPLATSVDWAQIIDLSTNNAFAYGIQIFNKLMVLDTSYTDYLTFNNTITNAHLGLGCTDNVILGRCKDIQMIQNCTGNTIGDLCNSLTVNSDCALNFIGNYCEDITFGSNCIDNVLGETIQSSVIRDDSYYNIIVGGSAGNFIDYRCSTNIIGVACNNTRFGSNCINCVIGNGTDFTVIGKSCHDIIIGNGSASPNICASIEVGNDCTDINVPAGSFNVKITPQVTYLDLSTVATGILNTYFELGTYDFAGVSFAAATHMSLPYSKVVFTTSAVPWISGNSYNIGNRVIDTVNIYEIYECINPTSGTTAPSADAVNWVYYGTTARLKYTDELDNTVITDVNA